MTLYADIVATGKPDRNRVLQAFRGDKRIVGKKLKNFTVEVNNSATNNDLYTNHFNLNANHYDVEAIFE